MDIKENAEVLFTKLEKFLKTETVVGEPINIGDVTLVPFVTVSFGCGTGVGEGSDSQSKQVGSGGGLGAGVRISPDAVLIIKNGEVQMLPIKNKGNLNKLLEMVPGIVEKIKITKEDKCDKEDADVEE